MADFISVKNISRLPAGYDEVEYIQSDQNANSYIELANYTEFPIRVVIQAQGTKIGTLSQVLVSADISTGGAWFGLTNANKWGVGTGIGATTEINYDTKITADLTFSKTGNNAEVNGTVNDMEIYRSGTVVQGSPFRLFSAGSTYSFYGKIWYCKIYNGDNTLIYDFIPCKHGTEYGMYDLVGKQFYGNDGTGAFTGGNVVRGDYKKFISAKVLGRLPLGYTELEYIESDGTQYIDTDLSAPNGFRAVGKIQVTGTASGMTVIGTTTLSGSGAYSNRNFIVTDTRTSSAGGWCSGFGGTGYQYYGVSPVLDRVETFDICNVHGEERCVVNDTNYAISITGSKGEFYSGNLGIFAMKTSNGTIKNYGNFKLHYMKVYIDGTLERNFVPCKNSQNVIGMYDLVNGVFYQNAGTGTFTAGNEVGGGIKKFVSVREDLIPTIYERVGYIETTHTTLTNQAPVIKTNISIDQDTVCYIDYQQNIEYNSPSGGVWFFGARTSSSSGEYAFLIGSDGSLASPYNSVSGAGTFQVNGNVQNDTNRHQFLFKVREDLGTSRRFDNVSVTSNTAANKIKYEQFTVSNPLWIFGGLDGSTDRNRIAMKLYGFKVWQGTNETLALNLIPVKKKSNNEYGMYDTVSKQFYGNSGTGSFTGGI